MPGVLVHFVVAQRTLAKWRECSDGPPFEPDDPVAVNAFNHGAVGPDLGYFPGGERLLSDLAHTLRTGALTRALIRSACTDAERAFAWGWLTHVLADQSIHPWIGRGVGELTRDSADVFVDGATEPCGHLRVEMGVDTWFGARFPQARAIRLSPAFGSGAVGFMVDAYERVYGVTLSEDAFARSHRAAAVRVGQALATHGVLHWLRTGGPIERWLPSLPVLLRTCLRSTQVSELALSYLAPVSPEPWLIQGIEAEVDAQADRFLAHYREGAVGLDDHNLDTGRLIRLDPEHTGTLRALRGLRELRDSESPPRPVGPRPSCRRPTHAADRLSAAPSCPALWEVRF
ncbi:MAG: zinc dependent phospholipase C family protein [Gemmatimonadota bacterium]